MTKKPKYTRTSDILREMRLFQREVAVMMIEDILSNQPPTSISEAQDRYRDRLGEGFWVDNGKGWKADIRDTSVECLIKYGFAKEKTVVLSRRDGQLTKWIRDKEKLSKAAELETEYGSNKRQVEFRDEMCKHCETLGAGREAVYVYTDSRLDQLNDKSCKIGRHESSEMSSVVSRVLDQYGTGNAGLPVLRYVIKTQCAKTLETDLHREFAKSKLVGAMGTEWFEIDYKVVAEKFRNSKYDVFI